MTIGVAIVHFVIKIPKLVQMIVTIIYRVQAYQVLLVIPRWPPKSKMDARNFFFTFQYRADRGDFPRIIEIALFYI